MSELPTSSTLLMNNVVLIRMEPFPLFGKYLQKSGICLSVPLKKIFN